MKILTITPFIKDKTRLKAGKAEVYFKIRTDAKPTNFPANVYVDVKRFEQTSKFSKGKLDSDETAIRDYLNSIIKQLNQIEAKFIEAGTRYTVEMIKNRILEKDAESYAKNKTIREAFAFHKKYFLDLVVKGENKAGSYKKYRSVETYVNKFIKEKHNQTEFQLENVNNSFQKAFHLFLNGQVKLTAKNTVIKYIILFRKVIKTVTDEGWLKAYPLVNYEMTREEEVPTSLSLDEVRLIIMKKYKDEAKSTAKDYFLFAVMTGLAYADVIDLKKEHLVQIGSDKVIIKKRVKTGIEAKILLQPEAIDILKKYADKNENPEICFPYKSNKELNKQLKLVGQIAEIDKPIFFHMARHTFGCISVQQGLSTQTIKSAMAHSRESQTEHYARMFAPQSIQEQKKMNGTFANPSKTHLKKAS